MNLAKINEVIKASPAIQIQSKISLLQRRAWNVLLANAYNELPDKDIHTVSMVELAAKLGFDSKNEEYLKEMLRSLRFCEVEWNLLNKDNKQEWGVAGLLAEARIVDGICFYQFPHTLRLKLHNPRVYAKLNLRLQNRFRSQYALALWEICFDYFDTDRDQGETPFIPIEAFKSLMGLDETDYPDFKILNRDLIKTAIKEINDLTDYRVEVEQKRRGRWIAQLKFHIERVKRIPVQESIFPDIENLPPVALELVQAAIDRKVALQISDREWDFVAPEKLPMPGTYSDFAAYVAEKIEMSLLASDVRNRGGFIIEAIRENYQDEQVQKEREVRAEAEKKKELEDLTEEFRAKRATIIRRVVQENPELVEEATELVTSPYVLERLEDHASAMDAYQMGGMVKADIDVIIATKFCQDMLAPVITAYEDEKARILGDAG